MKPEGGNMSCCGIRERGSGFYCTRQWDHRGAHIATDTENNVLSSWPRRKTHRERHQAEAERQKGLRTVAKPGDPDYK